MSQAAKLAGRPAGSRGCGGNVQSRDSAACLGGEPGRCRQGFLWAGLVTPGLFPAGFLGTAPPANVVSVAFTASGESADSPLPASSLPERLKARALGKEVGCCTSHSYQFPREKTNKETNTFFFSEERTKKLTI